MTGTSHQIEEKNVRVFFTDLNSVYSEKAQNSSPPPPFFLFDKDKQRYDECMICGFYIEFGILSLSG